MTDAHDNPMGLDGFEFVEFTSPNPEAMADLFEKMGFTHVGTHKSKNVRRYAQGDINFLLNMDDAGQVAGFRNAHGPSANAMAFRVATPSACWVIPGPSAITAIRRHSGMRSPNSRS